MVWYYSLPLVYQVIFLLINSLFSINYCLAPWLKLELPAANSGGTHEVSYILAPLLYRCYLDACTFLYIYLHPLVSPQTEVGPASCLSHPPHANNSSQQWLWRGCEFLVGSSCSLFFSYFFSIKKLHTLHAISHNSSFTLKLELQSTSMPHQQQQQWFQREGEFLVGSSFYNYFPTAYNTPSMPSAITQLSHWIWHCKSPPCHTNNCRHQWL
jgi:hypothetical protein